MADHRSLTVGAKVKRGDFYLVSPLQVPFDKEK